jgi:hypothetical protein
VQGSLTYDWSAIQAMTESEWKQAEFLLIDQVSIDKDIIAMVTLGEMKSAKAVASLERAAKEDEVEVRSAALRSLVAITGDSEHVKQLNTVLGESNGAMSSAFVAYSLANSESPEAIEGLLEGLDAAFLPARINSWDGLEAKLRLPDELLNPHQTPIRVEVCKTLTPFPSVIREGAERLREIVRGLMAQKTPDELGLIYEPGDDPALLDRVWEGFRSAYPTYDIDAIRQLTGHNRAWIRAQMLFKLGQRDVRAAKAIEALGWTDMKPELEEAYEELKHLERIRVVMEEILAGMG